MTTPELLEVHWGLTGARVEPLGGGMNSQTWLVTHIGARYVAKRVAAAQVRELAVGCGIAATLATKGIVTGRPVPTRDGRLVVGELGLALLEHVDGRELTGGPEEEQVWMAETLAAVHTAGLADAVPRPTTFLPDWLSPRLAGVGEHPWLLDAIEAVRAETDPLDVTRSVVHNDPAPEAFVHDDRAGTTGLIDWGGAGRGPVLYDVASALMYLGGPEEGTAFLRTYAARGPVGVAELAWLDAYRRFRFAIQGTYFAWRLATDNRTGIADATGNEKGLRDARRGLSRLGLG